MHLIYTTNMPEMVKVKVQFKKNTIAFDPRQHDLYQLILLYITISRSYYMVRLFSFKREHFLYGDDA